MIQQQSKKHFSICGEKIILQPYRLKYVQEYHSWFTTYPDLLYLTGSELLSLEEEYKNHRSWIEDPTKYTFIIFSKEGKMVGDVNLFFSEWIEDHQAEINIMIAVKQARGKGFARQALKLVEAFALIYYKKREIIAKIKSDNEASIKLFASSGYVFVQEEKRYNQLQYRKNVQDQQQYKSMLTERVTEIKDIGSLFSIE